MSKLALGLHAAGLLVCYSAYGFLQEKILKGTYGPDEAHFTTTPLLVLWNRLFSIFTAVVVILVKSPTGYRARLTPSFPALAYAAVATCNVAATILQYSALLFVSYTTQSLAKTTKILPVLVMGALVYKKEHKARSWVAGGVILAGAATYLFSAPPRHGATHAHAETASSQLAPLWGALCLLGYLAADGLTSTTQEKYFGKNKTPGDPFGPESPVLDQMLWTNLWAMLYAVITLLVTLPTSSLQADLTLLMTEPALLFDVIALSLSSSVGLIILLNSIASFGALTTSTIMTVRQFLSILINAGAFGNFGATSMIGWVGVGWVASGVFINTNKKYDEENRPKVRKDSNAYLLGDEHKVRFSESSSEGSQEEEDEPILPWGKPKPIKPPVSQYFFQYVLPVLVPVLAAALFVPILGWATGAGWVQTDVVEGGYYDTQLHKVVDPTSCPHELHTTKYNTTVRTGLVSFPRSGNSYSRGLLERVTGFQTSSVYCDTALAETFHGECDSSANFLVKTHFPLDESPTDNLEYFRQFDRAVHLIRNPLDAIASFWHMRHLPADLGRAAHITKVKIDRFGADQRDEMLNLARNWVDHAMYWRGVPIQTHVVRYEDMRSSPVAEMLSLLNFQFQEDEGSLPTLERLACMVEKDEGLQAYKSRKPPLVATWSKYEPSLRKEILELTKTAVCAFGYDRLLLRQLGEVPEVAHLCDKMPYLNESEGWQTRR